MQVLVSNSQRQFGVQTRTQGGDCRQCAQPIRHIGVIDRTVEQPRGANAQPAGTQNLRGLFGVTPLRLVHYG
jgi:hypothetical protein